LRRVSNPDHSYAHLSVQSDELEPTQLTELIGLQPDRIALRGERSSTGKPVPRHNIWDIRSRLEGSALLDNHLRDLLDRIEGQAGRIVAVANHPRILSIGVSLVLETESGHPGVFLDAATVSRVARLGTGLDIDFYVDDSQADE
jgi:hypothetical protein